MNTAKRLLGIDEDEEEEKIDKIHIRERWEAEFIVHAMLRGHPQTPKEKELSEAMIAEVEKRLTAPNKWSKAIIRNIIGIAAVTAAVVGSSYLAIDQKPSDPTHEHQPEKK